MNPNAFIKPDGSNKEETHSITHQSLNILLNYLSSANEHKLLPLNTNFLEKEILIPDEAYDQNAMNEELQFILANSMNAANNGYMGHMDSLPTLYSIIGSLFSAALNNNMFSLEMSPYFTRIEYALINQIGSMFGLPHHLGGCIVSGGSLSNIQAIIVARNHFLKTNSGNLNSNKQLVLFASEHAHVSIKKAAMISGIGRIIYFFCFHPYPSFRRVFEKNLSFQMEYLLYLNQLYYLLKGAKHI